jgi:RNA polymerase sigma-70 factor (ECF subfamily)
MNTCYRQLRVQRTQRDFRAAELTADECQVLDSLCLTSSGREAGNPEKRALLRDLAEKIMLQLTPPEQMILTLMEVDGLTVEEIARLWGMSRVSVKVRAYRARKHALKIFRTLAKTPQQP